MSTVSVVVITLNEEKRLRRCLESARWADEIIVVDSFSRDRTIEIARAYTDRVYQHEYPGSSRQVERGIGYATGDWILILDADEVVTRELAEEIRTALARSSPPEGFFLCRRPWAFGRMIEHGGWYPDYQIRLFRRDRYRVNHAEVHGGFSVDGRTERLTGLVEHYTYDTVFDYVARMNEYTSLEVANKLASRPDLNVGRVKIAGSALSHFWQMFVIRGGYRDGFHGFVLALLDATYAMLLYAKLWEYRDASRRGRALPPITNAALNNIKRLS